MNKVILTGRLTSDPEVRYSTGEKNTAMVSFSLAVNRRFTNREDPSAQTADFPRCTAFGKTAEFIGKYFKKGMKADIEGRIQTGRYQNKEGQTVYTTDVVVENVEFGESKGSSGGGTESHNTTPRSNSGGFDGGYQKQQSFINIPEGVDEQLPFT